MKAFFYNCLGNSKVLDITSLFQIIKKEFVNKG